MDYPRVIVIGETFNLNFGGGITMTNLFKDWPCEKIGVITDKIVEANPKTHYSYYQLGYEEIKFPFPFHVFQSYVLSGPFQFPSGTNLSDLPLSSQLKKSEIKRIIHTLLNYFLKITGLISFFYKIDLSQTLKDWILDFKPQVIYVQPFHHNVMRFGNLIYKELKFPYAIHIMDDSVKYINHSVFFKRKLQRIIDSDFLELITNAKIRMCISDSMASEYLHRYGKSFLSFRNPIDIEQWIPFQKKNFDLNDGSLKIIYTGRLFSPTYKSLLDMCKVINALNMSKLNIVFDIFTYDKNAALKRKLNRYRGIRINNPVNVKEMPKLIQQYDIFFLCLDFDTKAQKYSRFSISTRTSEGMISGVPILVYAPSNSALFEYFSKTMSGTLVGERDTLLLKEAILNLLYDSSYRERISIKAVETSLHDSNALIVREEFRKALSRNCNE